MIEISDRQPRSRRPEVDAERREPAGPRVVEHGDVAGAGVPTTRSSRVSPSRSTATTQDSSAPDATLVAAVNAPVPVPCRMLMPPVVVVSTDLRKVHIEDHRTSSDSSTDTEFDREFDCIWVHMGAYGWLTEE